MRRGEWGLGGGESGQKCVKLLDILYVTELNNYILSKKRWLRLALQYAYNIVKVNACSRPTI